MDAVTHERCGVTTFGPGGGRYEWVCVKPPHDADYLTRKGKIVASNNPQVTYHYFVRRWPDGEQNVIDLD